MTAENQEYGVVIVTGFKNDTDYVARPHSRLGEVWQGEGFDVTIIHPDWPNGNFGETFEEIADVTTTGLNSGKKMIRVGSSAGGSALESTRAAFDRDAPVRDITICSRFDFATSNGTPDRSQLQRVSPLLVASIDHILATQGQMPIQPDNTLNMTAGNTDGRVPRGSSMLRDATVFEIPGGKSHFEAVGSVVFFHRNRMTGFGKTGMLQSA